MGLLSRLLGGGSKIDDQPFEEQEREFLENPVAADWREPAVETLVGATGPFGSYTNPIPVNGATGERMYMNRLRSASGRSFVYHRTSTAESDLTPHPLDRYEMVSLDGAEWRVLYFAPYHPRRSQMVPPGLHRIPWPRKAVEQIFLSMPMGVGIPVEDFPYGLPDAFEAWVPGKVPEELGAGVGKALRRMVEEMPPGIERPEDLNDEHYTPVDDEPILLQIQAAQSIPEILEYGMPGMDALEEGEGEFGSRGNPIPVNGHRGMVVYLNRLRTLEEAPFVYHSTGTVESELTEAGLERIELVSVDGKEWRILYFSLYHLRRSQLTPPGLLREPWPSDPRLKAFLIAPLGILERAEDFPNRLADQFSEWSKDRFPPEIAEVFRDFLVHHLEYLPGDLRRPSNLDSQ